MKLIALFFSLIVTGCGTYEAVVDSDTSWSGDFDGRTVDGRGQRVIELGKHHPVCAVVQKQTEGGFLKVEIRGNGFLKPDGESKTTTAEYGVVSVCSTS